MPRIVLTALLAFAGTFLAPAAQAQAPEASGVGARPAAAPPAQTDHRAAIPALQVKRLVTGLDHPWDVRPIGGGQLIYTQRSRATVSIWTGDAKRVIKDFPSGSVWSSTDNPETGLMGLETDADFATNRTFYTCQGWLVGGGRHDIRLMSWTLDDNLTQVTSSDLLLGGLPTSTGRHGGCRIVQVGDRLYVGTGDAANGTNPRNLKSLGGKTLCLLTSGRPCPSNPFARARNHDKRFVHTYGHRNVQGIDVRQDGTLWSVEQGTYRDDEVNLLRNGADYGYNPVPGYNENVPMTDFSLPGRQRGAVWRSGNPTLATSGGGFVYGSGWGVYDGTFAVAAQKAERVLFLKLSKSGKLQGVRVPSALRKFGRMRTVVDGPGNVAYATTDNGNGRDSILAVRPQR